jgi:hypothetical protein
MYGNRYGSIVASRQRRAGAYSSAAQSRARMNRDSVAPGTRASSGIVGGRGRNESPGTARGSYSASAPGKYKKPSKKARKAAAAVGRGRVGIPGGFIKNSDRISM